MDAADVDVTLHDAGPSIVQHSYAGWRDDAIFTAWVAQCLPLAERCVGRDALHAAQAKKDARDGTRADGSAEYHVTLCLPYEFESLPDVEAPSKSKLRKLCLARCTQLVVDAAELSLSRATPLGLGRLEQADGNFALFVVVDWPEQQALRQRHGLQANHPHITIGFRESDIHGVPKDRGTLLSEPVDAANEASATGAPGGGDTLVVQPTGGEARRRESSRCDCCPPCSIL